MLIKRWSKILHMKPRLLYQKRCAAFCDAPKHPIIAVGIGRGVDGELSCGERFAVFLLYTHLAPKVLGANTQQNNIM